VSFGSNTSVVDTAADTVLSSGKYSNILLIFYAIWLPDISNAKV
jgi:hypothetical protein